MGSLEECSIALENALVYLDSYNSLTDQSIAKRMKLMQQEAKIRIQLCALFSQLHQHKDALEQAKNSTKLVHRLSRDLLSLCEFYTKKKQIKDKNYVNQNESQSKLMGDNMFDIEEEEKHSSISPLRQAAVHNYLEEDLSLIERTAQRVKPIIEALCDKLVKEKKVDDCDSLDEVESIYEIKSQKSNEKDNEEQPNKSVSMPAKKIEPDMRIVLGYLNQLEMISNLNIGNIMQIVPVKIEDLLSVPRNETEFNRASFIDKISLLCVSYFCISTEIRFIIQLKEDSDYDEKAKGEESEYWHAKSLEIACSFLPSDCPLLNHILLSYQKHHSPCQQTIHEDDENEQKLNIVKPLKGIESTKFMPIIRKIDAENIAITPSNISPADTITNQMIISFQSYINYGMNSMYQANNKSNILDYSDNKDKSRNTGTTRHRSVSPNVVGGENESFRSAQSKTAAPEPQEKDSALKQNSVGSNGSFSKKGSVGPTSDRQIIDKLLTYIMKEKNLQDKEKVLEALMADEFEHEESYRPQSKKKRDKDSLLMDSVLHNQHSTSYKEIHEEDSMNVGYQSHDLSKVNMTEDIGKHSFLLNDKKKAKDKKFLSKLVDRSHSGQKNRPKSSKGIRSSHVKVNTMSSNEGNHKNLKSKKVTNYLNMNMQGQRLRSKQSGRKKKAHMLGVRPSSSKECRNLKGLHR